MEGGGCTPRQSFICLFLIYGVGWAWIYGFTGYRNALVPLFTISIYLCTLGEIPLGVWPRVLASVG